MIINKKLLCYSNKYYLYSKGTKLYISRGIDETVTFLGNMPVGALKTIVSSIRIVARTLRLEPRCGIFIDKSIAIVSYHGAIYKVDCDNGTIDFEYKFRPEMNNPLCFTKIKGVNGFTDGIYYGEYYLNENRSSVKIYRRNEDGRWSSVYTFPAGSIYHIHGLVPCEKDSCVYVLTGDTDTESGIFRATDDFSEMHAVVTGRQSYRACAALPVDNGLLYATDTPLESNYLYYLDFNTKKIKEIMPIAGPCIYGRCISDNEMLFSTSVEPDSRITGIRYEFATILGPGVKDRSSHLYYVKWDGEQAHCKEILKLEKDFLPMGACQFGTLMFPDGEGQLYVTGQAVRKYDNKTFPIVL